MHSLALHNIDSSIFIHWSGIVVASGVCLYLACRFVDGIWDMELTSAVHEIVWGMILRNLIRWFAGIYILLISGSIIVSIVFIYQTPWKSLSWVCVALPMLRILFWVYWRTDEADDTYSWARNERANRQNIHGWERVLLWCFGWGPYEGIPIDASRGKPRLTSSAENPVDPK